MPIANVSSVQRAQQATIAAPIAGTTARQLAQVAGPQRVARPDDREGLLPVLNQFLLSRRPSISISLTNPLQEPFGVRVSVTGDRPGVATYTYVPIGDPGGGARLVDLPALPARQSRGVPQLGGGAWDGDLPLDDC